MEPFASNDAYKLAYPSATVCDERLEAMIMRSTRAIAAELRAAGIDYGSADEEYADLLADVCIDVTHRSLGDGSGDIPQGVTQFSETAGSMSWQMSMSNPYGDVFLTRTERKRLGIGRGTGRMLHAETAVL